MAATRLVVDAILFDMDGTLIDSTSGVLKAWNTFAKDYGFDAQIVARCSHGRRLYDTLKEWCRIDDEEKLQSEIARFEEEVIKGGPTLLPGTQSLLGQLNSQTPSRWTIVTSATNIFTSAALTRCAIPIPRAGFVSSNDVTRGKPHPDPYIMGAKKCGVNPDRCLVIEDAPSGLKAGHAAGAKTLAVCTSHTRQEILDAGAKPDYIAMDLSRVSAQCVDGKIEVIVVESTGSEDEDKATKGGDGGNDAD